MLKIQAKPKKTRTVNKQTKEKNEAAVTAKKGPRRFPGVAGNAGNHGKDKKVHKSDQILNQTKRNINKLCLGKISFQKTLGIKFFVVSGFSNMLYGKKRKLGNAGNLQKAF